MTHVAPVQSSGDQALSVALELSAKTWKLALGVGRGHRPRRKDVGAGDRESLVREIETAKKRFGLPATAPVITCYEAGRDGFWVHRLLTSLGYRSLVIDASSTQVDRRRRRAKTDRLDAEMLLDHLLRYVAGARKVFRVLHVPSREAEDARHVQRQLEVLRRDRARITSRVRSLLATQGAFRALKVNRKLLMELDKLQLWDGSQLMPGLLARLKAELQRWAEHSDRIQTLMAHRRQLQAAGAFGSQEAIRLQRLKALAEESGWSFSVECFAYRKFTNGRQVGSYMGLTPTPYDSGESRREQGIDKAGNERLRWRGIEMGWLWLRYQPDSDLSRWYRRRFGEGSSRHRRIGIVALARKLVVALWRYLEHGVVPAGATLKA